VDYYNYKFGLLNFAPGETKVIPGAVYRSAFIAALLNPSLLTFSLGQPGQGGVVWTPSSSHQIVPALYCEFFDLLWSDIHVTNISAVNNALRYIDIQDEAACCGRETWCGGLTVNSKAVVVTALPFNWRTVLPRNTLREVLILSDPYDQAFGYDYDTVNHPTASVVGLTNFSSDYIIMPYRIYGDIVREPVCIKPNAGMTGLAVTELVRV